jgi:hypothetical protein
MLQVHADRNRCSAHTFTLVFAKQAPEAAIEKV